MNAKGAVGYGNAFCTKTFRQVEKFLESLKRGRPETPNLMLPAYETFVPVSLWYYICSGRWPHLVASERCETETAGLLIRDWTPEFVDFCSRFDMGPFQVVAGMRVERATCVTIRHDLHDTVYIGLFTEDMQCVADYMNDESMEFLASFFRIFDVKHHLDFECDPFFFCELPHTEGLSVLTRLLDHLETVYTINSPERLCED